jgi:hypothetical protein
MMDKAADPVSGYVPEKKEEAPKEPVAQVDDYGYGIEAAPAEKKEEVAEKKAEEPKKEEVKDKVTGYEEEAPKIAEAVKEVAPEEKKEDPKKEEELKLDAKGLPEAEVLKVKEFAKKHGVSKEAAQALLDEKKQEIKNVEEYVKSQKAEAEALQQRTRRGWHEELKSDPVFGGDKFAYNIMQAEKVIHDHMPNLKKKLAESKTMLPAYVMKDLAKLASRLYSTDKLTQGDPIVDTKPKDEKEEHLAFYT